MKKAIVILALLLLATAGMSLFAAEQIDLRFVVVTNNGTNFDVKVQCRRVAGGTWDNMGDANLPFYFNTSGLDDPALQTAHGFNSGSYNALTVTDNGSWGSVNIDYTGSDGGGTAVPTGSWTDVATVRFNVLDAGQTSNLTWRTDGSFTCYDDNGTTNVSPGTTTGLDTSLPVALKALAASGSAQGYVTVTWETASEAGALGYNVWRSSGQNSSYTCLTNVPIPSMGQSSQGGLYEYTDRSAQPGISYWYSIERISLDGESSFFSPVQMTVPPADFALGNNYPNPFNPETSISYQLPEACHVRIKVYSLLGREIATLVDSPMQASEHTVTWDGTDARGLTVSSGIYFIRMEAGAFTAMRKVTLMR